MSHRTRERRSSLDWKLLLVAAALLSGAPAFASETDEQPNKKKREPIYNPDADARAEVDRALAQAKRDHKRVLVKFGGNWCGWCYKLHDVFTKDPDVAPIIRSEFVVVHVDVRNNKELLLSYGEDNDQHGYPFLTVLDADGNVLTNQNTGDLEDGPEHAVAKVETFLLEHKAEPLDAREVLAAALARAKAEDKKVLVHLGAPWCGWCGVLDQFLHEHESLLAPDYVDVKIDVDRMTGGKQVAERLRKSRSGGIPWMVILDGEGNELVSSDGPQGNCGYPYHPQEIEHFLTMLRSTATRITEEQVAQLEQGLNGYREERERRRAEKDKQAKE